MVISTSLTHVLGRDLNVPFTAWELIKNESPERNMCIDFSARCGQQNRKSSPTATMTEAAIETK